MNLARAGSAFLAQGVSSLANLVTGLIVARSLGADGLGRYAYCLSVMLLVVAVTSAWVGDSATVLDRRDPRIRAGLSNSQWILAVGGAGVAGLVVLVTTDLDLGTVSLFALLTLLWQMEEYGRRLFMARLEFVRQGINDAVYGGVSIGLLMVAELLLGLSLAVVFASMAAGASGAWLAGHVTLPTGERLRAPRWTCEGLPQVAAYGFWRAAQSGTGWAVQAGVRLMVISSASAASLGTLEAGRLLVAPLFVMLAAVANMLLPTMVRAKGRGRQRALRTVVRASTMQLVACIGFGIALLSATDDLVGLLLGGGYEIPTSTLVGWLAVCAVMAATGSSTAAASVVLAGRSVFLLRALGSVVSLALSALVLAIARADMIPFAMAAGLLLSGTMLTVLASRSSAWDEP